MRSLTLTEDLLGETVDVFPGEKWAVIFQGMAQGSIRKGLGLPWQTSGLGAAAPHGRLGSIPGRGTNIPHATRVAKEKERKGLQCVPQGHGTQILPLPILFPHRRLPVCPDKHTLC